MTYVVFLVACLPPFIMMWAHHKGVFPLWLPFAYLVTMLTLCFHVLARDPRPDGTSVRMGAFAAMLGYAALLSLELAIENRGWVVTTCALLFSAISAVVGGFAAWSVVERPTDYDVEEAE